MLANYQTFLEYSPQANEVRPGLFLGGWQAFESRPFTHVLTVMDDPGIPFPQTMRSHLVIPLDDVPSANILDHFPKGISFIRSALAESGMLYVHCAAGVSRSATMVSAYLMATEGLTPEQAISAIKKARPIVNPNSGFLIQLQLFYEMSCKLDPENEGYRLYKMEELGKQWWKEMTVEMDTLAQVSDAPELQVARYRCRKCRRLLATEKNSIQAELGENRGYGPSGAQEASLFVEPMQWMTELSSGEVSGKLYCPNCKARLGSYSWSGIQSSQRTWITPAFQLHLSRLDVENSQAAPKVVISTPRF
ncbi:g4521 [Coccomyxa elongata]